MTIRSLTVLAFASLLLSARALAAGSTRSSSAASENDNYTLAVKAVENENYNRALRLLKNYATSLNSYKKALALDTDPIGAFGLIYVAFIQRDFLEFPGFRQAWRGLATGLLSRR